MNRDKLDKAFRVALITRWDKLIQNSLGLISDSDVKFLLMKPNKMEDFLNSVEKSERERLDQLLRDNEYVSLDGWGLRYVNGFGIYSLKF